MKAARVTGALAAFFAAGIGCAFGAPKEAVDLPKDGNWRFRVVQKIEAPFSQRLEKKTGHLLEVDAWVESGSLVATNEKSKVELVSGSGEILRLGSKTVVVFPASRALRIKAGSALLHLPEGAKPVTFSTSVSQAELAGAGTFLLEATGNGGFKAIGLSGEPKIVLIDGTERIVRPGNLTFVLESPGKFGPTLDIDLLTLVSTSNLISGFEQPLACNAELMQSMMLQRTRIRQRTRSFVGDAKDNQNFQLLDLGEKKNK